MKKSQEQVSLERAYDFTSHPCFRDFLKFIEELRDHQIEVCCKAHDPADLYNAQGQVAAFGQVLKLKDEVYGLLTQEDASAPD